MNFTRSLGERQRQGLSLARVQGFVISSGPLYWSDVAGSEHAGRLQLFVATYLVYRNPRAHRENTGRDSNERLREFVLLNELYLLEAAAKVRADAAAI